MPDQSDAARAPAVDIGVIVIKNEEFEAVLAAFSEESAPGLFVSSATHRHYNLRAADAGGGQHYRVAIARQTEQGNGEAQALAHDLIRDLSPALLLVVGIAGAPPSGDVTLGDVVLATRVHDYSVQAATPSGPEYAMSGGPISTAIARGVANLSARKADLGAWWVGLPPRPPVHFDDAANYPSPDESWNARVKVSLVRHFRDNVRTTPFFQPGVLASSDVLVKDPVPLLIWLDSSRQILAIEMESAGVYRAANERCAMLAIRGISDVVGFKRSEEWTQYACQAAAQFAKAYLRTTPIPPSALAPPNKASSSPPTATSGSDGHGAGPTSQVQSAALVVPTFFLPPVASLRSRDGAQVAPLLWLLRIEPPGAVDATKAELSKAAETAIVSYNLRNYQRQGYWPRALQLDEAQRSLLNDGSQRWAHPYATGFANERGDEQLQVERSGAVVFQRATFWDVEALALDFGRLAVDALLFLIFSGRYLKQLRVEHARVRLLVHCPRVEPQVVAHFNYPPLAPEDVSCVARLSQPDLATESSVSRAGLLDRGLVVGTTKRLLDGIANEFAQERSILNPGSAAFMSIDESSVARLYDEFFA